MTAAEIVDAIKEHPEIKSVWVSGDDDWLERLAEHARHFITLECNLDNYPGDVSGEDEIPALDSAAVILTVVLINQVGMEHARSLSLFDGINVELQDMPFTVRRIITRHKRLWSPSADA